MSRMTAALLIAVAPAPALAQRQVTAEEALANYRKMFNSPGEIDCPKDTAEIVVCAERDAPDPNRLPLRQDPEPGARVAGHVPTGGDAMRAEGCISRCHRPMTVNILAIPGLIGKLIERLKDD